jgi:hypothetical protein
MLVKSGERFVAFFDLLGFKSWVLEEGSAEVFEYVRGFLNLMIRASLPGSIVNPDMSVEVKDSNIAFVNFSDSILFYTKDDSDECFEMMLKVTSEFMNGVICGPSRLMRGAIAHGLFFADPESNAYVGKAMIDAYLLEEAQTWLSISFHNTVTALPQFSRALAKHPNFIVRALVPLRRSYKEPHGIPYCINWADTAHFVGHAFNTEHGLDDCFKRGLKSLKGNAKEVRKLGIRVKRTRQFLARYNGLPNRGSLMLG